MTEFDMRTWALRGAEQRLVEIADEASRIYAAFPELRDRQQGSIASAGRGRARKAGADQPRAAAQPRTAETEAAPAARRKRRRVNMSAEAKQRIAEAQRKRWAEWRAKQGAATDGAARARGRSAKKR